MSKKASAVQVLVFLLFILVFFFLNICTKDITFSEQENRILQQEPSFTLSNLFSGKYSKDFETYLTDQFAFRDSWITIKAKIALIMGFKENNGYFLTDNDTIIESFSAPNYEDLDFSLEALDSLNTNVDIPVFFALIPSSCEIWQDRLPNGAPVSSQRDIINYCYKFSKTNSLLTIDLYDELNQHHAEPIYYRTDHHWTTLGAYYGYSSIANAMGFAPIPLESFSERIVTDSFYGTAYSGSGFTWVEPDTISTFVDPGNTIIQNYSNGEPSVTTMYDDTSLLKKDKYSYFYGGNTPLLTIETEQKAAPSLLVLRDSYFDSLSPFLINHFSKIHIIDLRYYRTSLKEYIAANNIDNILVCYNVKNFCEDGNIFLAAY